MNEENMRDKVSLKDKATRYAAPADLRQTIQLAIAADVAQPSKAPSTSFLQQAWSKLALMFTGGAAVGVMASLLAVYVLGFGAGTSAENRLADEVASAHVRSLMASHLEDVASSDRHTVKPWFAGKLDFSPPVIDFAEQGFPLSGGRLDYINKRTAAALVYYHRKHAINVFVWPSDGVASSAPITVSRSGFHLMSWRRGGMQFWAASDLNVEELQQFARLLSNAT